MTALWPEGAVWAEELVRRLTARLPAYEAEPDQALRRNKAAHMLAEVVKGMEHVPGVTSAMLMPFKDLLIFAADLERGRRHPWSTPISFGGSNQESVAETELRIWTIVTALVLVDAGYGRKEAYQKMEAAAAKTGRDIPWRTIQRWVRTHENSEDRRLSQVQQHLDNFWQPLPCRHGALVHACPVSGGGKCVDIKAYADQVLARTFTLPKLRDRFIS